MKKIIIYVLYFFLTVEMMSRIYSFFDQLSRPSLINAQIIDSIGVRGRPYARWAPKAARLNRYGFNDDDNYEKDKKASIRILCMGDSITFNSFGDRKDSWPKVLERMIRTRGIKVEVINAAIPGNTWPEIIRRFEKDYFSFRPDFLIVYKDHRHYISNNPKTNPETENVWLKILKKSKFVEELIARAPRVQEPGDPYLRLVHRRKLLKIKSLVTEISEEKRMAYKNDVERLAQICRNNRTTLVLSSFPSLTDEQNFGKNIDVIYKALYWYPDIDVQGYLNGKLEFNRLTKDIAQKNSLVYVDISDGLEKNLIAFRDDYHLSPSGLKIVAENYYKALLPHILLIKQKREQANTKKMVREYSTKM